MLAGCGIKGGLKTPSQIQAAEEKEARRTAKETAREQKRKAREEEKKQEAAPTPGRDAPPGIGEPSTAPLYTPRGNE